MVRSIVSSIDGGEELRFAKAALYTLQEAVEGYLVGWFEDAQFATSHAKRKTLFSKDLALVMRIKYGTTIDSKRI